MSENPSTGPAQGQRIDLEEAARLVAALEDDLAKAKGGSSEDLQSLRDEVDALRRVLSSPERAHDEVHRGLSNIREIMDNARDALLEEAITVADYVARIGRMLGM